MLGLATIGSGNFGRRSELRDFEINIYISWRENCEKQGQKTVFEAENAGFEARNAVFEPKLTDFGPKFDDFGPKMTENGPKMVKNGPKMTDFEPKMVENGRIHSFSAEKEKICREFTRKSVFLPGKTPENGIFTRVFLYFARSFL
jgi:hypothetical protein